MVGITFHGFPPGRAPRKSPQTRSVTMDLAPSPYERHPGCCARSLGSEQPAAHLLQGLPEPLILSRPK